MYLLIFICLHQEGSWEAGEKAGQLTQYSLLILDLESPVSFFLVGTLYLIARILSWVNCPPRFLFVYFNYYFVLAFSSGLDFWMPPSFSLDRNITGSNQSHRHMVTSPFQTASSMAWSILWLLIILIFSQHHLTWKGPYLCHPCPSYSENWEVELVTLKEKDSGSDLSSFTFEFCWL